MSWKRVADRVRSGRALLGLTQAQAAKRAGVGITTWQQLERGESEEYRDTTLVKVDRLLGAPPGWLRELADDRHRETVREIAFPIILSRDDGSQVNALLPRSLDSLPSLFQNPTLLRDLRRTYGSEDLGHVEALLREQVTAGVPGVPKPSDIEAEERIQYLERAFDGADEDERSRLLLEAARLAARKLRDDARTND